MKSGSLPKRTVTRRLWLAFGLLVFVLLLAGAILYWQIQRIDRGVVQVVEVEEPLERAILEMQISAGDTARAVSDYIRGRDPADEKKARDSEADFERVAVEFNELTRTDEAQRLGQEVARLYDEFKGTGHEIMTLVDRHYSAVQLFREDVKEVKGLIDEMLRATVVTTSPDAMMKVEAALDMEGALDKASIAVEAYIAEPDPTLVQEVMDAQADFERFGAVYRETSLSAYENRWLDHIDKRLEEAVNDGIEIVAITDNLHRLLGQFEQSLGEIDAHIDDQMRPLVHAQAIKALEDAQASTTTAAKSLLILGVIGILIGSASAWVISRKITNPVRDLVEGGKIVSSGRLEHRFCVDAEGEFGQLAFALNQMLENLGRSREVLGESEEMAWSLLDATSDAVILTDSRGVILASNEVAAQRFGKGLEQMIDLCLYDLLPADLVASRKAQIAEVINSGKPTHFEDERGGMILDQRIYPISSGKGDVTRVAIFTSDVTVRKWVEQVTEQLGRRNELILEAAGEGIYGLDTEGRTTFVNPAAARMLGYKPEDLIGQRHHELVHHSRPDGKRYPHEQCPIYAAFKDGDVRSSVDDEVFWRKDGTCFPVEYTSTPIVENGKIAGAVVTFQDITERKRVEKALRQSEAKYRSVIESAANLIISVDKEGIVIDCNDRVQQMLGYAPNEIIGQRLAEIVHPDERTKLQECLREILTKGFEYNKEYKMVQKDGTLIDASINAAAVRDANGQYVRTICMIGDITEHSTSAKMGPMLGQG